MAIVSVIIPTYNRSELLNNSINSVLSQTFGDFELIVIDDCSTDNTPHVLGSFSDERMKIIRNSSNRGIAAVRNIGVTSAKGEYIAFLDDDDEWMPTKLEKQLILLENSTHKIGAVYTGVYSIDMQMGRIVKTSIPKYRGDILIELLKNNFITTSSTVIKKFCFKEIGLFDPEYKSAEDYDMWLRIATKFDFEYVAEPLVNYRNHPKKISTNYEGLIMGLERLITKHKNLFVSNNRAYVNHLLKIGVYQCFNGKFQDGRQTFRIALRLSPFDLRLYYNMLISFLGRGVFMKLKETKQLISPP